MKRQNGKNEANMEKTTTEVKLLFSLGWGGLVMVLKKVGFGFCVCVCFCFLLFLKIVHIW